MCPGKSSQQLQVSGRTTMNEQIKELVKQAGGHFSTQTLTSYPVQYRESIGLWDNNIEKFAELIVKECAGVIEQNLYNNNSTWDRDVKAIAFDVKQHFGVEE